MKIVVVYESLFGNTRTIGEAIAEGLGEFGEVVSGTVDEIPPRYAADAELLVVGGPTHAHGMARVDAHEAVAASRSYERYGPVMPGWVSLRGWIDRLPPGPAKVVAFDTRLDKPMIVTGSAAKKIANRVRNRGYEVVGMQSFFVEATGGPLAEGERDQALAWGRELGFELGALVAA